MRLKKNETFFEKSFIKKILIIIVFLSFISIPAFAESFYTPSSETHCDYETNICWKAEYGTPLFTQVNGEWKSFMEVADVSWVGSPYYGFNFSVEDFWFTLRPFVIYNGNYKTYYDIKQAFPDVNIKDYIWAGKFAHKFAINLSGVPAGLMSNLDNLGFQLLDSSGITWNDVEREGLRLILKGKYVIDFTDIKNSGFTLNPVNKTYLLIGNVSENYQNGMIYLDPTIKLQLKNVDNLGDTYILEASPVSNFGTLADILLGEMGSTNTYHAMSKWNLSLVPPAQKIINAVTCMYLHANYLNTGTEGYTIYVHHLYPNYTFAGNEWKETNPTWNTKPNSSQYNLTPESSISFTGNSGTGWYCWNTTQMVGRSYDNLWNYSVFFNSSDEYGNPTGNDFIKFYSKDEATQTSLIAYTNITYEIGVLATLVDYYAIDSVGARIDSFNSANLEEIENLVLNISIESFANVSSWYLNFTADGTNGCSLGNKQSSACYIYPSWVQFINNVNTATYDGTQGNIGDRIVETVVGSGLNINISYVIDEHYNPNVFKWYDALYNFSDVKWQDGANERLIGGHLLKVELDDTLIPLDAGQYKLDFRVMTYGNPDRPLEAYLCNSTYATGHAHNYDGCAFVSQKYPYELQDDGTKFRGLFTRNLIDQLGDIKYVILELHDANVSKYYAIKTYKATAPAYTTHWEYSTDGGATWNNSGDGYETELNINWFYDGGDPTVFRYSFWVNNTDGDDYVLSGNVTWDIDQTNNYPPLVNILLPLPSSGIVVPYNITFGIDDPNDDSLNVSLYLYDEGMSLVKVLATGLTESDAYFEMDSNQTLGGYNLVLEACELNTTELFCSNATRSFSITGYESDLSVDYPSSINVTGDYRIFINYTHNSVHIPSASVVICYEFSPEECYNCTEGADQYYFDFTFDGTHGGIGLFGVTASHENYTTQQYNFTITLFNAYLGVRFWENLNMTTPYFNEFLWVYAKPKCDLWETLFFLGLYTTCEDIHYHAKYVGGVANLSLWSVNTYELWIVDGSVQWACDTCPPNVTGYTHWLKFDEVLIDEAGVYIADYFWNTTVEGEYPLFTDYEWKFWSSVAGIVILFAVVILVAYFTQNGVAVFLSMILMYILLKLFGILTGAIFFGLF